MKKLKKNKKYSAIVLVIVAIMIAFEFYNENINNNLSSSNQIELIKCIDGDTANFTKIGKTRFLFIDTPESTKKIEPYGKKAAKFTCDSLKNASIITYEYDGAKKDRYDRTLVWIFVDGDLLQEMIAREGYVKKYYDYKNNYKYENRIRANLNDRFKIFEGE